MKAKIVLFIIVILSMQIFSQTEFSQENAEKYVKVLASDIGPRPMGSPAEQRALKFALEKFKSFGCDTAFISEMIKTKYTNTSSGNVVGVKFGATQKVIVIGGHLDSAGPEIPGAIDNASGSAVVLELARILAKRENQSTLFFVLFGGEEYGLVGSENFLEDIMVEGISLYKGKNITYQPALDSIILMLNVDMANGLGDIEIDPHGAELNAPRWLVKAAVEEFYNLGYKNLIYTVHAQTINNSVRRSASSDHENFINHGIPALDFTTDINTPIHTPQDNLENFDPRGLKRSGDLILRLVERFDNGIPSRNVEEYWMYLIGKYPIFLPIWALRVFIAFAFLIAVLTVIIKRRKRLLVYNAPVIENSSTPPPRPKGKFTGIKVLILSVIPFLLAMFAFYLIGWLKNLNRPWYADPFPYFLNAFLFLLVGFWLVFHIAKVFSLTSCHYSFYFKSAVVMIIFLAGALLLDTKLAIYPAIALLFISLSALFKNQYIKILLLTLAPLPILRLIFNEWFYFTLRMYVLHSVEIPGRHTQLFVNAALIAFFTVVFFPFFLAFGSIYRESPITQNIVKKFKSVKVFATLIALIILMNFYLYMQPSYNQIWQKPVLVKQTFDINNKKFYTILRSPEYLNGIKIKYQNNDTIISATEKEIVLIEMDSLPIDLKNYKIKMVGEYFESFGHQDDDESVIKPVNYKQWEKYKDTVLNIMHATLNLKYSPYKIDINLSGKKHIFKDFDVYCEDNLNKFSIWSMHQDSSGIEYCNLKYYYFPEVPIKLCFNFGGRKSKEDTVKVDFRFVYNYPLYPVKVSRENTNFIFRSEIIKEEVF